MIYRPENHDYDSSIHAIIIVLLTSGKEESLQPLVALSQCYKVLHKEFGY